VATVFAGAPGFAATKVAKHPVLARRAVGRGCFVADRLDDSSQVAELAPAAVLASTVRQSSRANRVALLEKPRSARNWQVDSMLVGKVAQPEDEKCSMSLASFAASAANPRSAAEEQRWGRRANHPPPAKAPRERVSCWLAENSRSRIRQNQPAAAVRE